MTNGEIIIITLQVIIILLLLVVTWSVAVRNGKQHTDTHHDSHEKEDRSPTHHVR